MVEIIAENNSLAIQKVYEYIKQGELVSFPTETVFALACDATNSLAVEKIYQAKDRSNDKPLSILAYNLEQLSEFCEINDRIIKLVKAFCPGPLTIIAKLKQNNILAKNINNNSDNIGFRIPNHNFCLDLLAKFKYPIIGTSANISGFPDSKNAEEIKRSLGDKVKVIINGDISEKVQASTVISAVDEIKLLRKGQITFDEILKALGE
ncbi:MAG: threonylcarbamoyl-AMP synthase [Sphingobacteriia bacterium]|nr:threonylcarbamoyl-AMP synthase [Sphingobacteriia bacterium]